MTTTVGLIFGGRTREHDVTLLSASSVVAALPPDHRVLLFGLDRHDRWLDAAASAELLLSAGTLDDATLAAKLAPEPAPAPADRWGPRGGLWGADVVFPLVHGDVGEDGTLQGLLELLGVPYVGSGVAASAVGLDKIFMKAVFAAAGLPVVPSVAVRRDQATDEDALVARVEAALPGYPLFVKAANAGSSVGVEKVRDRAALAPAVRMALGYDRRVLIEAGVAAREIEVAVLGGEALEASVPGEVIPRKDWYDYEAKYTAGLADLVVPAAVPPELAARLRALAIEAVQAVGAEGLARVDFFVEGAGERIWLNEINTLPGFTATSMYPQLWAASGMPYPELIRRLLDLARARHAAKAPAARGA